MLTSRACTCTHIRTHACTHTQERERERFCLDVVYSKFFTTLYNYCQFIPVSITSDLSVSMSLGNQKCCCLFNKFLFILNFIWLLHTMYRITNCLLFMTLACSAGIMCMFLDYKSLNADSFSEALLLIFFFSKLCMIIMSYTLYIFMSVLTTLMLNFKVTW